jgi:hypothetical protein
VHSIPTGTHGINQLQIVGSTLYVRIGAASRTGNPTSENVYTMTVARIVDLIQIDFSGSIGADFTGPSTTWRMQWNGATRPAPTAGCGTTRAAFAIPSEC